MLNHIIENIAPATIRPRERAWRTHPPMQLDLMCASLRERGIVQPPLIDSSNTVVCGALVVQAAVLIGLNTIPVLRVDKLSDEELRLYAIAANRLADLAGYDELLLGEELRELERLLDAPDFTSLGFEAAELDRILKLTASDLGLHDDDADATLEPGPAVSSLNDVWDCESHVLMCGDALNPASYSALMDDELSRFTLSDVPYNLPADAISSNGKFKHEDFVMGSGEMTPVQFTRFLTTAMRNISQVSMDGSLHAFFMSYHFLLELLRAGNVVFGRPKAICTWVKRQGGQGSLFRSQTEFIGYFKLGTAKHVNSVMMGKYGRNRTTAWMFDGMNTPSTERDELLEIHPTCKPVDMLQEAILDVSHRSDIVLDPFAGSGSIILAAARAERRARCMELDPRYVDAALRRVSKTLQLDPIRRRDGAHFSELEAERRFQQSRLGEGDE